MLLSIPQLFAFNFNKPEKAQFLEMLKKIYQIINLIFNVNVIQINGKKIMSYIKKTMAK